MIAHGQPRVSRATTEGFAGLRRARLWQLDLERARRQLASCKTLERTSFGAFLPCIGGWCGVLHRRSALASGHERCDLGLVSRRETPAAAASQKAPKSLAQLLVEHGAAALLRPGVGPGRTKIRRPVHRRPAQRTAPDGAAAPTKKRQRTAPK